MRQETKFDTVAAIILFLILLALLSLGPMVPKTGIWGVLYFLAVITLSVPLSIIMRRPIRLCMEGFSKISPSLSGIGATILSTGSLIILFARKIKK
jgi:hypothetical protein